MATPVRTTAAREGQELRTVRSRVSVGLLWRKKGARVWSSPTPTPSGRIRGDASPRTGHASALRRHGVNRCLSRSGEWLRRTTALEIELEASLQVTAASRRRTEPAGTDFA